MDSITEGCGRMLWALDWANHAEESECTDVGGHNIMDIMPEPHPFAFLEAARLIGHVERASGRGIVSLLWACLNADGTHHAQRDDYARFGECLAYMATGNGVSWFDDHAPCDVLKVPGVDVDLHQEVVDACCPGGRN